MSYILGSASTSPPHKNGSLNRSRLLRFSLKFCTHFSQFQASSALGQLHSPLFDHRNNAWRHKHYTLQGVISLSTHYLSQKQILSSAPYSQITCSDTLSRAGLDNKRLPMTVSAALDYMKTFSNTI